MLWNRNEHSQLLHHLQAVLSSFGYLLHSYRWAVVGIAWDVGSIQSLDGFSTIWRVLPVHGGVGAAKEGRPSHVWDISRADVPFLHLPWRPQSPREHERVEGLGRLPIPDFGGIQEENQFPVAEEDITWVRYPVGMATLSWKRIMESTRRAINSRAFITRRTSLYLRKPF